MTQEWPHPRTAGDMLSKRGAVEASGHLDPLSGRNVRLQTGDPEVPCTGCYETSKRSLSGWFHAALDVCRALRPGQACVLPPRTVSQPGVGPKGPARVQSQGKATQGKEGSQGAFSLEHGHSTPQPLFETLKLT